MTLTTPQVQGRVLRNPQLVSRTTTTRANPRTPATIPQGVRKGISVARHCSGDPEVYISDKPAETAEADVDGTHEDVLYDHKAAAQRETIDRRRTHELGDSSAQRDEARHDDWTTRFAEMYSTARAEQEQAAPWDLRADDLVDFMPQRYVSVGVGPAEGDRQHIVTLTRWGSSCTCQDGKAHDRTKLGHRIRHPDCEHATLVKQQLGCTSLPYDFQSGMQAAFDTFQNSHLFDRERVMAHASSESACPMISQPDDMISTVIAHPSELRGRRLHANEILYVPDVLCREDDFSMYGAATDEFAARGSNLVFMPRDAGNHTAVRGVDERQSPTMARVHAVAQDYLGMEVAQNAFNEYKDGNDCKSYHVDRHGFDTTYGINCKENTTVICSLGESRILSFRHKETKERVYQFTMKNGGMLVFGARVNRHWEHAVLKPGAGADVKGRVSAVLWGYCPQDF